MAGSARFLFKLNFGLFGRNVSRHIFLNQTRTLFSEQSIGMTAFLRARNQYKNQFVNLEDSLRKKMQGYVEDSSGGMIFTEDLKVMLHIAEKTPEDIDLIVKMLKKFNSQSPEMRFGSFNFGPVIMRSFHRLNEPDVALQLFNDPTLSSFFYQLSAYLVFMDLLYINKKYKEMRAVYDTIQERMTDARVHPRNTLILVTGACYKENTEESMKYALDLWRRLNERGYELSRRSLEFLAAMSIRQGQPHIALEILTGARRVRYFGIKCLKIMAYADLDRVEDVIPFFRESLAASDTSPRKDTYFKDTIEKVDSAIERNKVDPESEIVQLLKSIKSNGMVDAQTMEDHLDHEIVLLPRTAFPTSGFSQGSRTQNDNFAPNNYRKPGLRDLV